MLKITHQGLLNIISILHKNVYRFLIVGIIFLALYLRVTLYGDPTLSIAAGDTVSYIESSRVPLFSSEIMTGRRLLTTNILYKILGPREGYQILANGSISTIRREVQPDFTNIVIAQLILSITGWSLLIFSISENLINPIMKILSAIIITLFAFTPQMADWDSILMSESFTFSLFALQLAVLTNLVFRIYRDPDSNNSVQTIIWAILFFAWTFLRDTNLFASLVTIGMTGILFLSGRYRKVRYLFWILALSMGILILGLITSSTSTRSLIQMANIYKDDLLSSPARVTALEELGMPAPDSADYPEWFRQSASKTLVKFMFLHPGYPLQKIIRDFPNAFMEIKQTYFKAPAYAETRKLLMKIGNALHPESATPFLMDLLLMIGLLLLASRNPSGTIHPWAWLGLWLMLTASITIIPTILGDTWAINRHSLFSTTVYRLFMWIFPLVIMDIAVEQNAINIKSR